MSILLLIILLFIVGVVYILYNAKNKKSIKGKVDNINIEVDRAPISKDVVVTVVSKNGIIFIDKTFLKYEDDDGDVITHVKYRIENADIYLDENLTKVYEQWTELPIDSIIYIKSKEGDVHELKYQVKSNDKWSK